MLILLAATLLAPIRPAAAQPLEPAFQPAPDEFDWIQFASGEWLKGELVALYDGTLEFDSEQLGLVTPDWPDVRQVRTARVVQVRFLGQPPMTGRLSVDGDVVRIVGDEERQFERQALLTIVGGEPTWSNRWSGKVSMGANLRSGNTNQTELTIIARALRRAVRSRASLEYLGNYSTINDVNATDNQRASADIDWFVTDRLFVRPVEAEVYRDPFQNIEQRWTYGAALGYQLVDTPRVDWDVSAGPAYGYTRYVSVEEGTRNESSTGALSVSTTYAHEIVSDVDFLLDYKFQLTQENAGLFNHHLVTGLALGVVGFLDVDLTFVWDRLRKPRAGADGVLPRQDDYRFALGLGFGF